MDLELEPIRSPGQVLVFFVDHRDLRGHRLQHRLRMPRELADHALLGLGDPRQQRASLQIALVVELALELRQLFAQHAASDRGRHVDDMRTRATIRVDGGRIAPALSGS